MGDGGTERDRGPARRESRGERSADRGRAEARSAAAGGRSPENTARTSSPAGSRESGADSDGQPGVGETDHCRRILVRGKRAARGPGPLDPTLPRLGSPISPPAPPPHPYSQSVNIIPSVRGALDIDRSAGDKAAHGVKEREVGAGTPPCTPRGRCGERRPGSAGSGLGGSEPRTAGRGRARALLGGRGAARPTAQPCFPFPATQTALVAPRRGTRTWGMTLAALARLRYVLSVPTSLGRLGPAAVGEAFSGPDLPLSPSPFSLLSSFPAISPRRARLLGTLPASAPGLHPGTQLSLAVSLAF